MLCRSSGNSYNTFIQAVTYWLPSFSWYTVIMTRSPDANLNKPEMAERKLTTYELIKDLKVDIFRLEVRLDEIQLSLIKKRFTIIMRTPDNEVEEKYETFLEARKAFDERRTEVRRATSATRMTLYEYDQVITSESGHN